MRAQRGSLSLTCTRARCGPVPRHAEKIKLRIARGITDALDVRLTVRRPKKKGEKLIRDKKRNDNVSQIECSYAELFDAARTIRKQCVNNVKINA